MIVITMTNCPPKLRGDLSLWLMEIGTGVYVGQVNARVREALWSRVCEHIHEGQATMVYTTNNEQHMEFRVHNTCWKPVDYDGIQLMKRPLSQSAAMEVLPKGFSTAAKQRMGRRRRNRELSDCYAILDIETTGLSHETDSILEIGLLEVQGDKSISEADWLIQTDTQIPAAITELTGLTKAVLDSGGVPLKAALQQLQERIRAKQVICYNANFDCLFLEAACRKCDMPTLDFQVIDAMQYAKRNLKGLVNYKLETVAQALDVDMTQRHRALEDCKLLFMVWKKLNEI